MKIKNCLSLLCLGLIFFQMTSFGQTLEMVLDSMISDAFDDYQSGLAVIAVQDGKTLYHKGFGKANIELDAPMEKDYIFRIGSITKQFTACAILQLQEQGKLSVQDPISKYFPDYGTEGKEVTVEHLLTHTSGIPSYTGAPEWDAEARKRDFEPMELLEEYATDTLEFDPGTKWNYNNTGYFMLGVIIEQVSGQTYEEYIEKNFFEKLGMESSYYGHPEEIIEGRASGYDATEEGLNNAHYLSMSQPYAAGSLLSSVSDLAEWNQAVFSDQVISKSSREAAHTPYVLANGESTGYGYGWGVGTQYDERTISHGGGINGFSTMAVYFPDHDLFVAAFSNCTCYSPGNLPAKIGATILGKDLTKTEIELPVEQLEKFVGKYQMEGGFQIDITLEEGGLQAQATGQPKFPIFPMSETKFFLKVVEAELEFLITDEVVEGLQMFQGGMQIKFDKLE